MTVAQRFPRLGNNSSVRLSIEHRDAVKRMALAGSYRAAKLLGVAPSTIDKIVTGGWLRPEAAERIAATLSGLDAAPSTSAGKASRAV